MPTVIWIIIGVLVLAALFGGGKKAADSRGEGPYRIDRPHAVDPDDYECSACHGRFRDNVMACPYCGARFLKRVTDDTEYEDEEDELEAWDEEDGI